MNNDFFHSWGGTAVIFTRDYCTCENCCRIAALGEKSYFKLISYIVLYDFHGTGKIITHAMLPQK